MKRIRVKIQNLLLFTWCAIRQGTPIWEWRRAYRAVQEAHRQEVRRALWELKKEGKVYEDENGLFWPKK